MLEGCKKCKGKNLTKGGSIRGKQRYRCKDCGCYSTDTPVLYRTEQEKLLALQLYSNGLSLRQIGKLLKVSQVSVMRWIRLLVPLLYPKLKPEGRIMVMELDEMWHYLKTNPVGSGFGRLCMVYQEDFLTGNLGIVMGGLLKDSLID